MWFVFGVYWNKLLFAIRTMSNFDAFCSSNLATKQHWIEWNPSQAKLKSCSFFFRQRQRRSSDQNWRCFNGATFYTKWLSPQLNFSLVVMKTCWRASLFSSFAMADARNSSFVSYMCVLYLAANINISPKYSPNKGPQKPPPCSKSWQLQHEAYCYGIFWH